MKKYLFKILVLIGITLPQCAVAHPDGAPAETCGNMMPSHGAVAQTGQSPYLISATTSSYKCKDTLTVTLAATTGNMEGFLCQARQNKDDGNTKVGMLSASSGMAMKEPCGSGMGLTHANNNGKTQVQFKWTSDKKVGNVTFVCTVVQSEKTFWVKLTSNPITYTEGGDCSGVGHVIAPVGLMILLLVSKIFI